MKQKLKIIEVFPIHKRDRYLLIPAELVDNIYRQNGGAVIEIHMPKDDTPYAALIEGSFFKNVE